MRGDGYSGDSGTNGNQRYYLPSNSSNASASIPNDFQPGGQAASFVTRLANHISNLFAQDAQPGSTVAQNGGHMDIGPNLTSATLRNDGTRESIIATFKMDSLASSFSSLSVAASLGAGWSITTSPGSPNQKYVVKVALYSSNQLKLTTNLPLPTGQNILFYEGIGDGHIAFTDNYDHIVDPSDNPGYSQMNGQGTSIYDNLGMPVLANPGGFVISGT